ncbi:MAG: helix-turn-helix transcriptional regulator [Clostridia bacterium]|nr:helix-turn-helix transcriptional regulator [Clostridia bacterium]
MNDCLNLEQPPVFRTCFYYAGSEEIHTVKADPILDTVLFLVRGELSSSGLRMKAGRYHILRAADTAVLSGDNPEYFAIRFEGCFTAAGQSLPLDGRFDYGETVRHWNRLLELADLEKEGRSVSKMEQEALFCLILSQLYEVSSLPKNEYLAQILMKDISSRYTEPISLKELSEKYFYSPNYLIRVFRKKYGVTPYRHILHMRIDKAKQLLSSTDKTCQQIAELCGYRDMSVFHRAFVAATGRSPDQWRKGPADPTPKEHRRGDYRNSSHALRDGE